MTMLDVRYLYLFHNAYLIYITGIIAHTLKKNNIYIKKKNHQNIFVSIYLLKKSSYKKKFPNI